MCATYVLHTSVLKKYMAVALEVHLFVAGASCPNIGMALDWLKTK